MNGWKLQQFIYLPLLFLVGWFFCDASKLSVAQVACCSSGSTCRPSNTTRSETSGATADGFDSSFLQRNKYSMGRQETIAYSNSFRGWMILGTRKGGRTQNKPSRRIIVYDFFATPSPDVWTKRTRRQMSSQIDWWQRYPSGRVCQSWRTFCHCWSLK